MADVAIAPAKPADYGRAYEAVLAARLGCPTDILELGVQSGRSLLLWKSLFPSGVIVGVDLNAAHIDDETGRIHLVQGFQQDPSTLDRAAALAPDGFDVIIDDASHIAEYTAASFRYLFHQHLKPGGWYVLEDWTVAYQEAWPDGTAYRPPAEGQNRFEGLRRALRSRARAVRRSLPRSLGDRVEGWYFRAESVGMHKSWPSHDAGMAGLVKQLIDECAVKTDGIASITVYPRIVFIGKDPAPETRDAGHAHS
jgi:SAM-dependent methyltransferase